MEKYYTIKEIAELLRVNRNTVSKLIRNKRLGAVNVSSGKKPIWRIFDGQYQKFLAESYRDNEKDSIKED